jgi:hypothetical protein
MRLVNFKIIMCIILHLDISQSLSAGLKMIIEFGPCPVLRLKNKKILSSAFKIFNDIDTYCFVIEQSQGFKSVKYNVT